MIGEWLGKNFAPYVDKKMVEQLAEQEEIIYLLAAWHHKDGPNKEMETQRTIKMATAVVKAIKATVAHFTDKQKDTDNE